MGLVQYSDSEGSDDEQDLQTVAADTRAAPKTTTTSETTTEKKFSSIVDRGNPRKIRIALPEIKAEDQPGQSEYDQDGPARKKPRTGGGGLFSGFNSILPAPKRTNLPTTNSTSGNASGNRKVFSLRTGAGPGFDREADAAWREDQTLNSTPPASSDSSAVPKSGGAHNDGKEGSLLKEENYKKKGNAMIFKPLSVARNTSKKKSAAFVAARATPAVTPNASGSKRPEESTNKHESSTSATAESSDATSTQKPRVSLFSFSSDEKVAPAPSSHEYESIVYAPHESDVPSDVAEDLSTLHEHNVPHALYSSPSTEQQSTLDAIASDLNLSRAQRRQLMGRNSAAAQNNSRILTFNTDAEYASNQEMLSKTTEEELAAAQHNPVRAIAPGKHSLRQLVQAANSQKDALEDSFAAGRRNKKEAGARYGW